ncbi:MAG: hypothetical protein GY716_11400 [bacterium]|nr:hypothetical protein [bacterium]
MLHDFRRCFLPLVTAALFAFPSIAGERPKVVVIGFDGADARLVERWMDAGELPNLAGLREDGGYAPLQPTNPPQTPVSWSSFATGTDPGKTEIFDFLKRDPGSYLPDFAMASEGKQTFLFGERNRKMVGFIAAGALFVVLVLLTLPFKMGWKVRVPVALALAVAGGLGAGYAAGEYLPTETPTAINNRQGDTIWELARRAGKKSQIIRVPATFPAEPMGSGHMLSGLGVPDMRGRIGTPSFYTSDPAFDIGDNKFSLEPVRLPARRGTIETRVIGPRNKPFYDYEVDRRVARAPRAEQRKARRQARRDLDDAGIRSRLDLPLVLEVDDTTAVIELAGRSETLAVGEWSEWFELPFEVNPLVDRVSPLKGLARFKLLQLEPELELYMSPINFHPDCHPVAFSWPPDYSEEIKERFGLYKTIGWALDTWSLPSGVGDEQLFLDDMDFTVAKYEEIMDGLLGDGGVDLYVQIFYFTDRIGHLLWRYLDPDHPIYDPAKAARYEEEMLAAYKKMDELVGKARALAGPDALFLVCSDHGFSTFRRGVNYNNWLQQEGLLTLKQDASQDAANLEKLFDTKDLYGGVDWSKTKAYSLGLGAIYVNLVGREREGIVLPGPEYEEVRRTIKKGLEELVDDETGEHPVTRVWLREEMYSDFDPNLIPDLRVANNAGYRVSWQTSLGGFGPTVVEDNLDPWSGDHCSLDPTQVRGIFFSNRPINTTAPRMIDLAPTILEALEVEVPPVMDGRSLL